MMVENENPQNLLWSENDEMKKKCEAKKIRSGQVLCVLLKMCEKITGRCEIS